jgi:WD40 repeat protein
MNAGGSELRNLTRNPSRDYFQTWLPGGRIVFSSDRDGDSELYVINAEGSGLRNLTREWGRTPAGPWVAWWPSGEKVVFGGSSALYVMNADGSGRRKLVDAVQFDLAPTWSPDERRVAFEEHLGNWERGSREIFVVDSDGSGLQRLTQRPGNDDSPVWSPAQTAPLVSSLTREQYLARSSAIRADANKKLRKVERRLFGPPPYDTGTVTPAEWAVWHRAAARFAQESLGKLLLLAPPKDYRTQARKWLSLVRQEAVALRHAATAAAAGKTLNLDKWAEKRVELTHKKDAVGYLPGNCPVGLPA